MTFVSPGYNDGMSASLRKFQPILIVVFILFVGILPVIASVDAELDLAETNFKAGDFMPAADHFELAAAKLPWRLDISERAGVARFYAGELDKSLLQLGRLRDAHALTPEGWTVLGETYLSKSLAGDALQTWKTGLEEYPEHQEFYWHISRAFRSLGEITSERQALERWIAFGNADAQAHYRLALLSLLTDPGTTMDELRVASELDPEYRYVVDTLRTTLNLAGLEPDRSKSLSIIGRGLGLVNEWSLAREAFEQAVQFDPLESEAWAWLGEAQGQLGQDGLAALERALALDPNSVIVRGLRGRYWNREKEFEKALAEEHVAAELEPSNPAWQVALGESHYLMGDLAAALQDYQRAVELAPSDPTYLRLLAVFCAENSVHIEDIGIPAALKAVELKPGDPQMLDALGWSYYSSGRFTHAEQTLAEAISSDPLNFSAHMHLALTYLAVGRYADAHAELILVRDGSRDSSLADQANLLMQQYFQ